MISGIIIGGVMMEDSVKKTKHELNILKWKQLITDFNNSDMTLSEWCYLNHVGKSTYYKYLRLIRNDLLNEQSSSVKIESKRSFVPVNVDVSKSEPLTIIKGNVRIEFNHQSDLSTVMNIIKVLLC